MTKKEVNQTDKKTATGPLDGIRVIDMSTAIFGPYATRIFGDLGADVIKVESGVSDFVPRFGGPGRSQGMAPLHMSVNRNKRSIELDLKSPKDLDVAKALITTADVLLHSIRHDAAERLGLAYSQVQSLNPQLIYVHCVGYDSSSDYAGRQAYDDLIQGASAFTDLLPSRDHTDKPAYIPSLIADKTSGLHAAYATMAALFHRERTGEGQFIEVPMYESFLSFHMVENIWGRTFYPADEPPLFPRNISQHRRPIKVKDGHLAIMTHKDGWEHFFALGGHENIFDDIEFANQAETMEFSKEFYELADEVGQTNDVETWLSLLHEASIPAMKCLTTTELFEDDNLKSTGFFERRTHPTEGEILSVRHPITFSRTPASVRFDARRLGEDTADLVDELGFKPEDFANKN